MENFQKLLQAQFDKMCATGKLFKSSLSGESVWNYYLNSFKPEHNPVFRDPHSSSHNCQLCNNFMRRYGNIVAIDENYKLMSIWDIENAPEEYKNACEGLSKVLTSTPIKDVFFETFQELNLLPYESTNKIQEVYKLGNSKNVKRYTKEEAEKYANTVKPNQIFTFHHLHLFLPKQFVDFSGKSIEALQSEFRDAKNIFERGMKEIHLDTLLLVRDLIIQGSLLDGQTHLYKVEAMIGLSKEYSEINHGIDINNWFWIKSYKFASAKFRNELIGTLCVDLTEGKELNEAVKVWNTRVDPVNYMRAVAPMIEAMRKKAMKEYYDLGFVDEDILRRHATIEDIKASDILHLNSSSKEKSLSVFDSVKSVSTRHKKSEFDGVETVSIETFLKDIVPFSTSIEAFLMNNHERNLVNLTTSLKKEAKPLFKYSNNYSTTFQGNLAGISQIKKAVKGRGGNVTGDLRISLAFPNTTDDYDLHAIDSNENHIYYSNVRRPFPSSGMLDLDAQGVDGKQSPKERVENIIFTDKTQMKNGNVKIWVNNYSGRGIHTPFELEVEFENNLYHYISSTNTNNKMECVTIKVKNEEFEVIPTSNLTLTENSTVSREIFGLETNKFHKVSLICPSPNHWGENSIGNKYYLFMLAGAKNPVSIRGFHSEHLIPELANNRKVFEALGNAIMVEPSEKQIAGIGFNATVRDELIVKVQGSHNRVLKIKF